jgi:hypothetical protein
MPEATEEGRRRPARSGSSLDRPATGRAGRSNRSASAHETWTGLIHAGEVSSWGHGCSKDRHPIQGTPSLAQAVNRR